MYVRPKGYKFPAALVTTRISSSLAILVRNRVWFLHSGLELNNFFGRNYLKFSLVSMTITTKALHKSCLTQLCPP